MKNTPKKAIIIGASSGIGKALARELIQNNYRVGVTGRRKEQLVALQKEHPKEIYIKAFDCKQEDASDHIKALTDSLGGVDLFIISAGVGHINPNFDFNLEDQTNQLNVIAFTLVYQSNYIEGMAQKAIQSKLPIYTTDVRPGFVKTAMAKGPKMFWVSSKEKAAKQIFRSIQKKKRIVYITRRWMLIGWILKRIPWFIYKHM